MHRFWLFLLPLVAVFSHSAFAVAPVVSTVTPTAGSLLTTSAGFTSITVVFSQAVVNVTAEDLVLNEIPATTITPVGTGGTTYTFGFVQPTPGQVTVTWDPDNSIANSSGTQFGPGTPFFYTLQANSPPTVILETPPQGVTVDRLTQCEVTFSAPVQNVTAASLLINGQPAASVSGNGQGPYTFSFAQPPNGTITFQWAASQGITDLASPPNAFAGGSWTATMNTAGAVTTVRINEFLADNVNNPNVANPFVDEDGAFSGWIEIRNSGATSVNLAGWSLTNDATQPELWVFPSGSQSVIPANGFLVIWADSKNVTVPASGKKMHTNFTLSQNGSYLGLFTADLPRTTAVSQFSPSYPVQEGNVSYGFDSNNAQKYFATPTPGAANGTSTITGVTGDVSFSIGDGYFTAPFDLVITTPTAGAPIYYTTDCSVPTTTNGTVYTGPIPISATTVVRAAAIGANLLSSEVSTESFFFVASTLSQPANPPGFPTQFTGFPANNTWTETPSNVENGSQCYFQVDQGIATQDKSFITASLLSLPTLEVTTTIPDMFGQTTGLYCHPLESGTNWERPASFEMIFPDGSQPNVLLNCGVQLQGGSSRDPVKNFKHSFRMVFKDFYGSGQIQQSIFPDSPVGEYNSIVLDGGSNDTYDYVGGSGETYQRAFAQQTHDAYTSDLLIAMGWPSFHSKFCNLYIDGLYWGLYYYHDRDDGAFAANYWGGSKAEYDVLRITTSTLEVETSTNGFQLSTSVPTDPHLVQWNALMSFLSANSNNLANNAVYQQFLQFIDVDAFADYMIVNIFVGNTDWPSHNWYAISHGSQYGGSGKFYFAIWDAEHVLESNSASQIDSFDAGGPGQIFGALRTNAEFKLLFADHVQKAFFNGGVLAGLNPQNYYTKRTNEINNGIAGESAKWGAYTTFYANTPVTGGFAGFGSSSSEFVFGTYTRENQWLPVLNDLLSLGNPAISGDPSNKWFALRNAFSLGQFQSGSRVLFPASTAQAPVFSQFGGRVAPAFALSISLPAGTTLGATGAIYYTTDGSDPRVFGSGLPATAANGGTALAYTTPITLNASRTVKARILNGTGVWSAVTNASFSVGSPAVPVRIAEIMYNPAGGSQNEFVEIENVGTNSINLGGYYFEGITYIFPPATIIAPGQIMVIGNNSNITAWKAKYPAVSAIGFYNGSLDNSGEQIALLNPAGQIVDAVNYLPGSGWPTGANGSGFSLERINLSGDPDDPTNWQASAAAGGSPGQANSAPVSGTFQLSEIMANNVSSVNNGGLFPPWIEVQNTSASSAAIAGWTLSNPVTAQKYTFPAGTTIPAGGYLTVWCDNATAAPGLHTGFSLNPAGDTVQLSDGGAVRRDSVQFGNQPANYSIGRIGSAWQLTNATPNAANTAATLAPANSVVLNEWLANPTASNPSWIELYNKSATLPAALKGDLLQTATGLFQITALTFLDPNGYLQLFTDELPGANHVNFILPAAGTTLSLLDGNGNTLDTETVSALGMNVSQGRNPDGSATIVTFPNGGTPGAANFVNTYAGPMLNEVLAINATGAPAPWGTRAAWLEFFNPSATNSFDMSGMEVNVANSPSEAWTFPTGSVIPANSYLVLWCDPAHAVSTVFGADMNTALAPSGTSGGVYLFNSTGQLVNLVGYGFQVPDLSIGLASGQWQLLSAPTLGGANAAAAALGSVNNLRINEWLATESTGSDWFELYNQDPNPVNLTGLYLTDDPSSAGQTKFQISALSFIAGKGFVVFVADDVLDAGSNHASFKLNSSAENILLSNHDVNLTQIDAVSFGLATKDVTMGRIPDGAANIVSMPGSPTPGAKNILLPAPSISVQPLTQTVTTGTTVTLSITASGSAPLTYQWVFNNANIPGATSSTLPLGSVTAANDGTYHCILTNTAGVMSSNAAKLTVQQTYAQWQAFNFPAGTQLDTSPDGTPFNDGIPNLEKFLCNLNPMHAATAADRAALPQAGVMPATGAPQYVTLTFRQSSRATLTGVNLQLSTDLGTVPFATVAPSVIQNLGPDPTTGDPIVLWEVAVPPGQTTEFLRLQITQ